MVGLRWKKRLKRGFEVHGKKKGWSKFNTPRNSKGRADKKTGGVATVLKDPKPSYKDRKPLVSRVLR